MTALKICVYLLLLLSCGTFQKGDTIIVGVTQNAKAGAVVVSRDDGHIYYLDGLDYWNENIVGKTVQVSGNILIEKHDAENPTV